MAKNSTRRQVGGNTPRGDRITIGHVSSNGGAVKNARAKGCFGHNDLYAAYHTKKYLKKYRRKLNHGRP